jgi:hypothetical protein
MLFLWVVTPCTFVGRYQGFGEIYCRRLQSWSPHGVKTQTHNFGDRIVPLCTHVINSSTFKWSVSIFKLSCGLLRLQCELYRVKPVQNETRICRNWHSGSENAGCNSDEKVSFTRQNNKQLPHACPHSAPFPLRCERCLQAQAQVHAAPLTQSVSFVLWFAASRFRVWAPHLFD